MTDIQNLKSNFFYASPKAIWKRLYQPTHNTNKRDAIAIVAVSFRKKSQIQL